MKVRLPVPSLTEPSGACWRTRTGWMRCTGRPVGAVRIADTRRMRDVPHVALQELLTAPDPESQSVVVAAVAQALHGDGRSQRLARRCRTARAPGEVDVESRASPSAAAGRRRRTRLRARPAPPALETPVARSMISTVT